MFQFDLKIKRIYFILFLLKQKTVGCLLYSWEKNQLTRINSLKFQAKVGNDLLGQNIFKVGIEGFKKLWWIYAKILTESSVTRAYSRTWRHGCDSFRNRLSKTENGRRSTKKLQKREFFCYFGKQLSGSCDYHTHGNPIIYPGYFLLSLLLTVKKVSYYFNPFCPKSPFSGNALSYSPAVASQYWNKLKQKSIGWQCLKWQIFGRRTFLELWTTGKDHKCKNV